MNINSSDRMRYGRKQQIQLPRSLKNPGLSFRQIPARRILMGPRYRYRRVTTNMANVYNPAFLISTSGAVRAGIYRACRGQRPVMIHRALFGAIERFFAILLDITPALCLHGLPR